MDKLLKTFARPIEGALRLGAYAGLYERQAVKRFMGVLDLFSGEKIVRNFSNMDTIFLHDRMPETGAAPSPLPDGVPVALSQAAEDWIADRHVNAMVVMKGGQIVHERYLHGTGADDLRINWSISKSYLSALFGILLDEGAFDSLDDPVVKYAPSLQDGAYREARIVDVLQMSSGLDFNEDYLDFFSDINRMGRVLALGQSMDGFAVKQKKSHSKPGTIWQYCSIDTHVIGMVIRGATGQSVQQLLYERLIRPLGFERAPYYLTDGDGVAFALGGLVSTTRDNARFGQMFANGGRWNGQQIVPEAWVHASTRASATTPPGETDYGYQWWVPLGYAEGQFCARGIYGQAIYVDRLNDVVIAVHAANRNFRDDGVIQEDSDMYRQIAKELS